MVESYQAGKIIETFGRLVVGDSAVVGIVVFVILVTINFVADSQKALDGLLKWPRVLPWMRCPVNKWQSMQI